MNDQCASGFEHDAQHTMLGCRLKRVDVLDWRTLDSRNGVSAGDMGSGELSCWHR